MRLEAKVTYSDVVNQHLKILESLQTSSGLFLASKKGLKTGYDKAWLRDNFYECLAFEVLNDWKIVKKTYRALLDIFLMHEYKIDYALRNKPKHAYEYIHPRYHPETFDEFWDEWGNKQNDSIGAILFKIGELEFRHGIKILETEDDVRVVQKLVDYLKAIEYWHDPDSGMWEETEELHASSVGACVAGLKSIKRHTKIGVSSELIRRGQESLNKLLPRESNKKFVDLALLSLIWPYKVVTPHQTAEILKNLEYHLVKSRGVLRYKNDHYYNKNPDGHSEEAEWTFGFSWLSIIYSRLGNKERADYYMKKAMETVTDKGEIPELYFSNSPEHNENCPLGWAESLFIVALYDLHNKHGAHRLIS